MGYHTISSSFRTGQTFWVGLNKCHVFPEDIRDGWAGIFPVASATTIAGGEWLFRSAQARYPHDLDRRISFLVARRKADAGADTPVRDSRRYSVRAINVLQPVFPFTGRCDLSISGLIVKESQLYRSCTNISAHPLPGCRLED